MTAHTYDSSGRKLRKEDREFGASLSYTARPSLKKPRFIEHPLSNCLKKQNKNSTKIYSLLKSDKCIHAFPKRK
jgi:hypothetical protein